VKKLKQYPAWAPAIFVAPFVSATAVFVVYPLIQSIVLASQQTFGPRRTAFVGFENFHALMGDPMFWTAVRNTAVFAGGSLLIQMPAALGLAILLSRPDIRGRAIWRTIFFAPSLVGLAFVAVLAALVFEKNTGLLNVFLNAAIGFDREFPWLQEYVMSSLLIAAAWTSIGFYMVYFLAALQNVSQDLIEAAMVDGANAWQRFWNITIPAIRPVATFVCLLSLIGSFQLFELPYILLENSAGPDNRGLTVVMYLYQKGFDQGDLGYASAIGWFLAITLVLFACVQVKVSGVSDD